MSPQPFEGVYTARFAFVRRTLVHLGVPRADLEDALQETFVAAYRHWSEFRADGDERAWLFGISRRIAYRYRRSAARRAKLVRAYEPRDCHPPEPDSALAEREAADLLQRFLAGLTPRKREVFVLARLEGMTGIEVAATLGINANTMWSRLRAAQDELDRFVRVHRARMGFDGAEARARKAGDSGTRARIWALVLAKVPTAAGGLKPAMTAAAAMLCAVVGLSSPAAVAEVSTEVSVRPLPVATRAVDPRAAPTSPGSVTPSEPSAAMVSTPAPPIQRSESAASAAVETRTRRPPRRARAKRTAPKPVAKPEPPASAPSSTALAEEAKLLRAARVALRGRKSGVALRLLDQHDQRFADGVLTRERRALRIRALCMAGRETAAKALATGSGAQGAPIVARGCKALNRSTKSSASGEEDDR